MFFVKMDLMGSHGDPPNDILKKCTTEIIRKYGNRNYPKIWEPKLSENPGTKTKIIIIIIIVIIIVTR